MSATIRLPLSLRRQVAQDLERPHPFAYERVGFLFARYAGTASGGVLMAVDYAPVAERDYVEDRSVGARINGHAIRTALQRALTTGASVLHVHCHGHRGTPGFSQVDLRTLAELVPSFAGVAPGAAHGGLLLSVDQTAGKVWLPRSREAVTTRVVVVGFPMVLGDRYE